MKILITGGNGFLAKNIIDAFSESRNIILAPSRKELDCLAISNIESYLKKNNIDFVIHSAGEVGSIQDNINNPEKYFYNNALMGLNVVNTCFQKGIKNLLNIGSINSFPLIDSKVSNEDDLLNGPLEESIEAYGLAKSIVARYCSFISKNNNYNYKTLHLSNLFGKYDRFFNKPHMIPAIIARIHEAKEKQSKFVEIWGDGSAKRSFIYAKDVSIFIKQITEDYKSFPQDFILKGKNNFSVLEYNKLISREIGFEGNFKFNLDKPVGYKERLISSKYESRYNISFTPIEKSVKDVYNYYLNEVVK